MLYSLCFFTPIIWKFFYYIFFGFLSTFQIFKIYPKIKRLKDYLNIQKKCIFSRMTGSGSVCVAYFKDYKAARKAEINLKNKFPNYWCKLSKAM